jgi:cyclopropane-fatty-acyl-phospholipid synthase
MNITSVENTITTSITKTKTFVPAKGQLSKIARKLVHNQLLRLHTGCFQIEEDGEVFSFGQGIAETRLVARLVVHDASCYGEIMTGGTIGAAESFMTGDWSSPDLTMLVRVMVRNMDILDQIEGGLALISKPLLKGFHYFNQNSAKGSRRNIAAHYDLGNDLFEAFLDPTMMYSSGVFPAADASMEEASLNKLKITTHPQ